MNSIDSDLEEGEILDDSPSSPHLSVNKDRELPRRYVLIENKKAHKHKKRECKNAIRYHAKKLSKFYKVTPSKDALNNHHSSRTRTKSRKPIVKHYKPSSDRVAKINPSFSKNSLISEIKFSFKDNIKKNSHPEKNSNHEVYFSDTKHKTVNNDSNFHESSKKNESPLKNITDLKENNKHYVEKPVDSTNFKESYSSKGVNDEVIILPDLSDDKNEESEDEEELRRIALATCAKRKPLLENSNLNEDNSSVSLPESENSVQILPSPKRDLVADNYEIVDMELDEESSNEVEIIDNESLFVIDTQPSSNIEENVKNSDSGSQLKNDSDEDFEADILRAELIGSLFRKRAALEKQIEEAQDKSVVHPEEIPLLQDKSSETYQKPKVDFQPKPLQPTKRHIFRQNGVNKHRKMKFNSKAKTPSNKIEMSPKRLVITVNAESSSSEEESDEAENSVPDNPVASIEALISDCRQKSDSNEKSNETKNNEVIKPVPKALSCLSKAQQEEYNNLMKILAEKKKLPVPQEARPQNSGTAHSPLDDLKLLEEKLSKFQETLKRKKILMTSISKDVNAKKQLYMKSKLRAQHLKEQFLAAEKVRRIKLDEWSKSCHNFDVVKKSVSGLESKIAQMQNLCSKINLSIQGLSYNLSPLPANNVQL